MTANDDFELQQWAADWQAAPDDVDSTEQIRRYVTSRTGLLWSFAAADLVIGAIAIPVLLYIGITSNSEIERMAMLALASITVAAVLLGWWNRRGVMRASATTIANHIAISTARIERMRVALRIGWLVLIAEVVVFTVWIWDRVYSGDRLPAPGEAQFAWSWLTGITMLAILGLLKFARWIDRDAERFDAIARELGSDLTAEPGSTAGHALHRRVDKRRGKRPDQIRR